ncbi:GyrI-like domain-containing protein [Massilia sp. H-1]|nr:GyrI-like domain-containing protein [Massilia sp. H-1]
MLETPHIARAEPCQAAVIHVTVPRSQIQQVMGPAINEVIAAVSAQGIGPLGPVFAHHLTLSAETFDFEVGVPVSGPVTPSGRVKAGQLQGGRVARTVFQGNYDQLHAAWGQFGEWIRAQQVRTAPDLWEVYAKGPESDPNPASWRTELNQPLLD